MLFGNSNSNNNSNTSGINSRDTRYTPLSNNVDDDEQIVELSTVNILHANSTQNASDEFSIKLLCKESSHDIHRLKNETTIADLKRKIAEITEIPAHRQRLIVSGKPLRPDDKNLAFFKITAETSIHLFPLPEANPVAASTETPSASTAPVARAVPAASMNPSIMMNPFMSNDAATVLNNYHTPMHFDQEIGQTSREVRLWCLILISLSAMTLFNNLSYLSATGKLGNGALDTIVFLLDTICSVGGIYVGGMGMKSIRTLNLADIRKYVHWLGILAMMCFVLRITWVVDIVIQVQEAVKHSHDNDNNDSSNNGGNNADNSGDTKPVLDSRTVVTVGIQASIIAIICIGAWMSCLGRAVRLHAAVRAYEVNTTNANPTATNQV